MTPEEKLHLAETDDMSKRAVCRRFRAAVSAAGYARQRDFADAIGSRGVTSINNAFTEKQFPSREMMAVLFRGHRIDFNFILAGQFNQLPGDVQDSLFAALSRDMPKSDQAES